MNRLRKVCAKCARVPRNPLILLRSCLRFSRLAQSAAKCAEAHALQAFARCASVLRKVAPYGESALCALALPSPVWVARKSIGVGNDNRTATIPYARIFWMWA